MNIILYGSARLGFVTTFAANFYTAQTFLFLLLAKLSVSFDPLARVCILIRSRGSEETVKFAFFVHLTKDSSSRVIALLSFDF